MAKVGEEDPKLLESQLDMWVAKKCTGDYHQEYQKNVNKAGWHKILERVCKYCYDQGHESSDLESESEIQNDE